jgi:hypothetical protein
MQALLAEARARGAAVPEVSWAVPGERAGRAALQGAPDSFLSPARLRLYATKRNDPGVPQVRRWWLGDLTARGVCRARAADGVCACVQLRVRLGWRADAGGTGFPAHRPALLTQPRHPPKT